MARPIVSYRIGEVQVSVFENIHKTKPIKYWRVRIKTEYDDRARKKKIEQFIDVYYDTMKKIRAAILMAEDFMISNDKMYPKRLTREELEKQQKRLKKEHKERLKLRRKQVGLKDKE